MNEKIHDDWLIALLNDARLRAGDDAAAAGDDARATEAAPAARWTADQIASAARQVRARVMAARLPVARVDHLPDERSVPAVGLLSQVLDAAVASGCAPFLNLAAAAGLGRELWDAECESWIELPTELPRGRYIALRVSGDSMAPLMQSGDVVLVQLGPRLVSGSVVVARRPDDGYVVKRVGKIRRTTVDLLSLNPSFAPITIPRSEQLVVGTVVMRWSATGNRE
jgi:SOS-response transcriptional repressor LexA